MRKDDSDDRVNGVRVHDSALTADEFVGGQWFHSSCFGPRFVSHHIPGLRFANDRQ